MHWHQVLPKFEAWLCVICLESVNTFRPKEMLIESTRIYRACQRTMILRSKSSIKSMMAKWQLDFIFVSLVRNVRLSDITKNREGEKCGIRRSRTYAFRSCPIKFHIKIGRNWYSIIKGSWFTQQIWYSSNSIHDKLTVLVFIIYKTGISDPMSNKLIYFQSYVSHCFNNGNVLSPPFIITDNVTRTSHLFYFPQGPDLLTIKKTTSPQTLHDIQ